VAQPWELALADALEERFGRIRRLARSVSRVRMAFRQHAKLEWAVGEESRGSLDAARDRGDGALNGTPETR
jgi:hypothetical protein